MGFSAQEFANHSRKSWPAATLARMQGWNDVFSVLIIAGVVVVGLYPYCDATSSRA